MGALLHPPPPRGDARGNRYSVPPQLHVVYPGSSTGAVSLLDRLLHHATTVVTTGQSYRMRDAKTRAGGRPST